MLIRISSTNPEFYSLLQKNPNSFQGIQLREIKNGTGIGFLNNGHYDLLFQDTKYSFADDLSCQIDYQSFCNPKVLLALVGEFIRHFLAPTEDYFGQNISWLQLPVSSIDTPGHTHVLEIENLYADGFSLKQGFVFSKYFPEVQLTHKAGHLFSLRIETQDSLYRLINLAVLTCMYLAATNEQPWYLSTDLLKKYIRVMKNLKPVPYFIIYLFAKRCIREQKDFDLLKSEMEAAFAGSLNLSWGSSQEMRIKAVESRICRDERTIPYHVFEVGCGEMDYPRRFLGRMEPDRRWFSTDLENYAHLIPAIQRRYNRETLSFCQGGFGNLDPSHRMALAEETALLMVEVIEHMPLEEAKRLVSETIANLESPDLIIITTPNRNFNRHFGPGRTFRHDDHHFELTPEEFVAYIEEVVPPIYERHYFGIGDQVDGDYLSQGVELRRIFNVN